MKITLRRNRSYWLRDPLVHETFMLGALQRLIRSGDTVFDVGANIGLYVRFMVRFGAQRVIAFEPSSDNKILLDSNIKLGNCQERTSVFAVALADYDGIDQFQCDDVSSATGTLNVVAQGRASQARRQYGLSPRAESVTVGRLDTMIESGAVPVPDVIKIDVEGAEERVLLGAVRTLETHRPRLVVELHGAEVARAVVRLLLHLGYSVFGNLNRRSGPVYQEIVASDIDLITKPYSLHHCVAACDGACLKEPVELRL